MNKHSGNTIHRACRLVVAATTLLLISLSPLVSYAQITTITVNPLRTLEVHPSEAHGVAFSPDETAIRLPVERALVMPPLVTTP